jgi:hypothetical protein
MTAMLRLVTNLGDAAFLLLASSALLGYLVLHRSPRAAVAWISTLVLCAGLTILAKIAFYACGDQLPTLAIHSPSGHVSFSTTFYCCAALMFSTDKERAVQLTFFLASGAIVLAIAASRVLLHAHTPTEVAAGLIIGLCCLAWFAFCYLHAPMPVLPLLPLGLVVLMLAYLADGRHLSIESRIAQLAQQLQLAGKACMLPNDAASAHVDPGKDRLVLDRPHPSL